MLTTKSNVSTKVALVSQEETYAVSLHDGKVLSLDSTKYANQNRLAYYVCMNTWFHQVDQIRAGAWIPMLQYAKVNGLIPLINLASYEAQRVVTTLSGDIPEPAESLLFDDLIAYCDINNVEDVRRLLQVLRYPKRFSPAGAQVLEMEGLNAFVAFNRRVKQLQRKEPPIWLLGAIRRVIRDLLPEADIPREELAVMGHFSNGASVESGKLLGDKVFEYFRTFGHYLDGLYPRSSGYFSRWSFYNGVCDWCYPYPAIMPRYHYYSQIQAVPKSYKTPRIIAKEWADRQFCMQAVRDYLYRRFQSGQFGHLIDLEDQSKSRMLAMLGSALGEYATIDLSSASDSLSLSFALSVLPNDVARMVDEVRSPYFRMPDVVPDPKLCKGWRPGERISAQMVHTSGAGTTFIVESVLFLAIAIVATELVECYLDTEVHYPRVYGDDMVVDARVFDTCLELLEKVGCIPNVEKSYVGDYTEACGSEWYKGVDIATNYYPRKTLVGSCSKVDDDSLAALIDLQHRLYEFRTANTFLTTLIRDFVPDMTSHVPGSDCTDLWEKVPLAVWPTTTGNRLDIDLPSWHLCTASPDPKDRLNCHYVGVAGKYTCEPLHWQLIGERGTNQLGDRLSLCSEEEARQSILDLDMYLYAQFLKDGPVYSDELDRLLLVSEQRKRNTLFTTVKSKYALR